jgi:bifunctional oligoribonuclease and PAP phosphatase NrnA
VIKAEELATVISALGKGKSFFITSHQEPDGDAICSMLALGSLLRRVGKTVHLELCDQVPERYRFVPHWEEISYHYDQRNHHSNGYTFIILDSGELCRVGEGIAELTSGSSDIINIDHHISNQYFGSINLVDANASATGEIVGVIYHSLGIEPTEDEAFCIYTAIFTDTGAFRYSNTTPQSLRLAAEMIEKGVMPQVVSRAISENKNFGNLKLMGFALSTLTSTLGGQFVYLYLNREMYKNSGITGMGDTEGLVNFARSIKGCRVSALFRETEDGRVKVSLRGSEGIDVNNVALHFGGGGHEMASGYISRENLVMTIETLNQHLATIFK